MDLKEQYKEDIEIENKTAENYDFLFSDVISYKERRKNIVNYIKKNFNKNIKILDIGCGSGILLKEIENKGFINLYGIDPSSKMIEQSLKKSNNFIVNVGFAENIKYPDNYFDLVIGTAVLHHIKDLRIISKEISRVLKDNGNILFHEPSKDWFFEEMSFLKEVLKIFLIYPLKTIPFLKNHKIKKYKKTLDDNPEKLPFHRHISKKEIQESFGNYFDLQIKTEDVIMPFFEGWLIKGKLDNIFYSFIRKIDRKIKLEGLGLIISGSKTKNINYE